MEFRRLEHFIKVCTHMNMTKAAQELHIAQPSISASIKTLEEELGVQLFDRSRRQLALTAEGIIFLERAKSLMKRIEDIQREMLDLSQKDGGQIKLGIPPMVGTILFPRIMIDFKKAYSNVALLLSEAGSLETRRQIVEEDIDLGIIILNGDESVLETHVLLETEIGVCMNRRHPLARFSVIKASQLADEKLIMLKEGFYHHSAILSYLGRHQITPEILIETDQIKTLEGLVVQGAGISFLFKEMIEQNSRMLYRPMDERLSIRIGLAWRKDRYLSRAAKSLIAFLEKSSFT